MAKRNVDVDLSESSVYGKNAEEGAEEMEPVADGIDGQIDGRIDDQETGGVGLDPSLDEEIDALKLDLTQEDDLPGRDGSGRVVDDVAEERLAEFTEVGRDLDDEGAESEVPGLDDTSQALRDRHPHTEFARADAIVEGNLDEPRDEEVGERDVDEGTAG